jgi:enoyl-CoA hydratase/carnithine racemase
MPETIITQQRGLSYEIIFNRVEKRNAMSWQMIEEISSALVEAEKLFNQNAVRALIIRAEGSMFSSGIDLNSFLSEENKYGEAWRSNLFPLTDDLQRVLTRIEQSSLPTICVMHGMCLGLGMELMLACDFRIAAERTRLGLPETRLGMIPDVGGTARLVKLAGVARAKELVMTGRNTTAEELERWGVLHYVVPKDELLKKADELVAELALAAPLAVSYAKRVINDISETQRALQIEAWAQAQLFRTEDFERGVTAMVTKNYPVEWKGK